MLFQQVTRFLDTEESTATPHDVPPRLTFQALESLRMSRSRERILNNLEEMYREAFERAKESGDPAQQASLDFAYRREQLYFEILLVVRYAIENMYGARGRRGIPGTPRPARYIPITNWAAPPRVGPSKRQLHRTPIGMTRLGWNHAASSHSSTPAERY